MWWSSQPQEPLWISGAEGELPNTFTLQWDTISLAPISAWEVQVGSYSQIIWHIYNISKTFKTVCWYFNFFIIQSQIWTPTSNHSVQIMDTTTWLKIIGSWIYCRSLPFTGEDRTKLDPHRWGKRATSRASPTKWKTTKRMLSDKTIPTTTTAATATTTTATSTKTKTTTTGA